MPEEFRNESKRNLFFVAEDTNSKKILSLIGIKNNEIRTFYVDTTHQRNGVGRALYTFVENKLKNKGLNEIVVEGNLVSEPAYKKFGFKRIKPIAKERVGIKYMNTLMKKAI